MLTLLLVLGLIAVGIAVDTALMWRSLRLFGSAQTWRRVLVVEASIVATALVLVLAGRFSLWANHPSVLVRVVQIVVASAIELGVIWFLIRRGFGLSAGRAAGVLGMRVGWSIIGIVLAMLVIRPFVIEAFAVGSGAMSPAIAGPHVKAVCSRCGGTLIVPVAPAGRGVRPTPQGICETCRMVGSSGPSVGAACGQDLILVNKLARPGRWDIAAYRTATGVLISRVVGLPGETVHIADGDVFVNGSKLAVPAHLTGQKYVGPPGLPMAYGAKDSPYTLKAGEYFLLGDFSAVANDSRFAGPVDGKEIVGVVGLRYWPLGRIGVP